MGNLGTSDVLCNTLWNLFGLVPKGIKLKAEWGSQTVGAMIRIVSHPRILFLSLNIPIGNRRSPDGRGSGIAALTEEHQ